ncbi:hypothetical protein [Prauserella flavalba]|uniref:hypothetical protein n=1 Tax=Prauserella flavalba TaxID=1477506 RepID=UPI0036E04B83
MNGSARLASGNARLANGSARLARWSGELAAPSGGLAGRSGGLARGAAPLPGAECRAGNLPACLSTRTSPPRQGGFRTARPRPSSRRRVRTASNRCR